MLVIVPDAMIDSRVPLGKRGVVEQPRLHVSVILEDSEGVLMVQEGKPDVYGKWNLPGGHMERGEVVTAAGLREVREETGLEAELTDLLGVFVSTGAVRFVMRGKVVSGIEKPGDDILAVRRFHFEELGDLDDDQIDGALVLRAVFSRLRAEAGFPLAVLIEELH